MQVHYDFMKLKCTEQFFPWDFHPWPCSVLTGSLHLSSASAKVKSFCEPAIEKKEMLLIICGSEIGILERYTLYVCTMYMSLMNVQGCIGSKVIIYNLFYYTILVGKSLLNQIKGLGLN